jgi:hypothetical protein
MSTENPEELFTQILRSLAEGKSPRKLTQELDKQGIEAESATALVKQANQIKQPAMRWAGFRISLIGIGCIIFGIFLTRLTNTRVITIGLFAFGAVNILRGLWFMLLG